MRYSPPRESVIHSRCSCRRRTLRPGQRIHFGNLAKSTLV